MRHGRPTSPPPLPLTPRQPLAGCTRQARGPRCSGDVGGQNAHDDAPAILSAATRLARSHLRLGNAAPPSKLWRAGPAPQPQRNARAAATRCPVSPSAPLSHSRVDATCWHTGDVAPLKTWATAPETRSDTAPLVAGGRVPLNDERHQRPRRTEPPPSVFPASNRITIASTRRRCRGMPRLTGRPVLRARARDAPTRARASSKRPRVAPQRVAQHWRSPAHGQDGRGACARAPVGSENVREWNSTTCTS